MDTRFSGYKYWSKCWRCKARTRMCDLILFFNVPSCWNCFGDYYGKAKENE